MPLGEHAPVFQLAQWSNGLLREPMSSLPISRLLSTQWHCLMSCWHSSSLKPLCANFRDFQPPAEHTSTVPYSSHRPAGITQPLRAGMAKSSGCPLSRNTSGGKPRNCAVRRFVSDSQHSWSVCVSCSKSRIHYLYSRTLLNVSKLSEK